MAIFYLVACKVARSLQPQVTGPGWQGLGWDPWARIQLGQGRAGTFWVFLNISLSASQKSFFSKTQYLGFQFFFKNVIIVFIEKSNFFLKSPHLLHKPLGLGKICILLIKNVCFQPFARFLDQ